MVEKGIDAVEKVAAGCGSDGARGVRTCRRFPVGRNLALSEKKSFIRVTAHVYVQVLPDSCLLADELFICSQASRIQHGNQSGAAEAW